MIAYLRRLLTALERVARLEAENTLLKEQASAREEAYNRLEKRFFSEITGNRRREDAQAALIRAAYRAPGHVPEHAPLADEAQAATEPEAAQPDLFKPDERKVREIADQFVAQNPTAYQTDDQYNALCAAIRHDPDNYF